MLSLKIHRGTHQIGGSIVELHCQGCHIFVDFGAELPTSATSTDADMVGMIRSAECDAVLFTHCHGDHIGLMRHIPPQDVRGRDIRLYMGAVARKLLANIHATLLPHEGEDKTHSRHLALLDDRERVLDLRDREQTTIGPFAITPLAVDHSAPDAFMFLIEAEGKAILHSGDFRTHGRLGEDFWQRLEALLHGRHIDALICEGTMMSRRGGPALSEVELTRKAAELLRQHPHAFLVCSSTNMESLASFCKAAVKGKRRFYANGYIMAQIATYRGEFGQMRPEFLFSGAHCFEPMGKPNPRLDEGVTQIEFMRRHGFLMHVRPHAAYHTRMACFDDLSPVLVYSLWEGYLNPDREAYAPDIAAFVRPFQEAGRFFALHSGGHATREDIGRLVAIVGAAQVIPIHTDRPEAFATLGKCVALPGDGDEMFF